MKDVKSDPRFSTILLLAQTGDRPALEKVLRKIQKPVYYYILRDARAGQGRQRDEDLANAIS